MKNELFYRTITRLISDYNHKSFLASLHEYKGHDSIVNEILLQKRFLIGVLNDCQEDLEMEEGLTLGFRQAKACFDGMEIIYSEICLEEVR